MNENTFSRRQFLQCSATIGAGAAISSSLFALEKNSGPATVLFGFSLYGMRKLSVPKALAVCKRIGYDCVELVATKGWHCDPDRLSAKQRTELRKQIGDSGLQVSAIMENVHLPVDAKTHRSNLDRLKRVAELGHQLSPKSPPVIETVLGGRPATWETLKGRMQERLKDWAKIAEAAKTVIAIKAHVGGALHRSQDARRMCDAVHSPWIRLAYDYSHFQLWGETLEDSLSRMIGRTVFIHVKDSTGKRGKFRFKLPGEGNIDYAKYFSLLKKHKYNGPVVVEVSGQIHGKPGYDPVAAAKTSYRNLAAKLKQAGIRRT